MNRDDEFALDDDARETDAAYERRARAALEAQRESDAEPEVQS